MLDLLLVLAPISLIDSTSVIPFAVVVLAVLLSGARPYLSSVLFLSGIVISYLASGMLITLGLGQFFDQISEWMVHTWQNPDTPGMLLQIVLGFLLIVIGGRLAARRTEKAPQREVSEGMTP